MRPGCAAARSPSAAGSTDPTARSPASSSARSASTTSARCSTAAVGKHGSAAIVEDNGTLVSRLPFDPHVVGLDLHSSPLFIESQRARDGALTGVGAIDGIRRIYV